MDQEMKDYREMTYSDIVEPVTNDLLPFCLSYALKLTNKRADLRDQFEQLVRSFSASMSDQDFNAYDRLTNSSFFQKITLGLLVEIYKRKNSEKIDENILYLDYIAFDQDVFDEANLDWSFFEQHYFNFAYYFSYRKQFSSRGIFPIENEFAWLLLKAFSPSSDQTVYIQNCGLGLIPALLHEYDVVCSDEHKEAMAITAIFRDASIRYFCEQQTSQEDDSLVADKYSQIIYISNKLNCEKEDPEIETLYNKLDQEGRMAIVVRTSWLSKPFDTLEEPGICHLYKDGAIKRIIQLNKDVIHGTNASVSIMIIDKVSFREEDSASIIYSDSIKMTDLTEKDFDNECSHNDFNHDSDGWLHYYWHYHSLEKGECPLDTPYDVTALVRHDDIKNHKGILVPALYRKPYYESSCYPLKIMDPIDHPEDIECVDIVSVDHLTSIFPYAPVVFDEWDSLLSGQEGSLWYRGPAAFFYRNNGKTFTGFIHDNRIFECAKEISVIKARDSKEAQYFAGHLQTWDTQEQIKAIDAFDNCFGKYPEHFSAIRFDDWENYEEFIQSRISGYLDAVNKRLKDSFELYQKEVHIRKHAMSQVVSPLAINTNILIDYLKAHNHQEIRLEDRVKKFRPETVLDIINSIKRNLSILERQTVNLAEIEYKWSDPKEIDPQAFISDYIANNRSTKYEFVFDDTRQNKRVLQDGTIEKDAYFDCPADALVQIMSDIISNAVSHGFKDPARNDYKIKFGWELNESDVVISIKNNGTPIHPDINTDDIFTYGVSSSFNDEDGHSGIGCYDIKNIIERQGGSVEVRRLSNSDFTVEYRLSFPNKRK